MVEDMGPGTVDDRFGMTSDFAFDHEISVIIAWALLCIQTFKNQINHTTEHTTP